MEFDYEALIDSLKENSSQTEPPAEIPYRSPLGRRYDSVTLAGSKRTDCLKKALEWKEGALILSGPPGCGKTYALACVARQIQESGEATPQVWDAAALANHLKFSEIEDRLPLIRRLKKCSVLIVDDMGAEAKSEFISSAWDEIMNARYSNGLRFLAATNLAWTDFKARYSARILDRLNEWGSFFESREGSLRGKKAA